MARIRTIKPEFFTSLTIGELTRDERLTFVGLWTHADDEGRCVADGRLIKAAIWPLDDDITAEVIEGHLQRLIESSLIAHYEVGGRRFLSVLGFPEHQRINRPTPSKLPPPEGGTPVPLTSRNEDSHSTHSQLSEDSSPERKGREQGTGKGTGIFTDPSSLRSEESGADAPRPNLVLVDGEPVTAQTIVGEWIERCKSRPPKAVIGQMAKTIRGLLEEGIAADDIRRGVAVWMTRKVHPSVLPSVVNDVMNGDSAPPAARADNSTQAILARQMERARARDAQEAASC